MAHWIWRSLCTTAVRKQVAGHWTDNWMNHLMLSWDTRVRAPSWYFRWCVGYLEKNLSWFSKSLSPSSWPFHLVLASDSMAQLWCLALSCNEHATAKGNDSALVWFVTTRAKLWQTAREFPPSRCLTELSSSCCCFLRSTHWCLGLFAATSVQRHRCM